MRVFVEVRKGHQILRKLEFEEVVSHPIWVLSSGLLEEQQVFSFTELSFPSQGCSYSKLSHHLKSILQKPSIKIILPLGRKSCRDGSSSEEHSLFFQRTQVWIPAPMLDASDSSCNSSSRGSSLSVLCRHLLLHVHTHECVCTQIQLQIIKINSSQVLKKGI